MIKAVPICLTLALVAGTASAHVRAGNEFQVNTYTTGTQGYPRVSANVSGDFVLVWETRQQNPGDFSDIYARRYESDGTPIGGEFRVSLLPGVLESRPAVALARSGEFVVVWTGNGDYSGTAIKARRYDALGNPAGAEFVINSYATNAQFDPAVAMDAQGNFVVVWASQDGSDYGIFGRRFDAVGTPIGLDFAVNSYTTARQTSPELALGAAGDFVVVWQSNGQDGSYYGVFGQHLSAVGWPLGSEFQVNTTTAGFQWFPGVAASAPGEFVAVWQGQSATFEPAILARRFGVFGVPASGEFQVNQQSGYSREWPTVASDPAGNFVVSWGAEAQDGDGRGVFARSYDPWGRALGSEFQVNTFTTSGQSLPSVSMAGHGAFVAAWSSFMQDSPNSQGVFGQRFSDLIFSDGFDPTPP